MKLIATITSLVALSFLLLPRAGTAGPPFEPTLSAIQANVFTPGCAVSYCHGSGQAANLHLEEGYSYASLVNVPSVEVPTAFRVEPFAPDDSYLICKLEACSWMVGVQMPIIGDPLDQAVIDVIRQWITDGAPDDDPVSVEETTWGRIKAIYR
jgi:hypothetical protein